MSRHRARIDGRLQLERTAPFVPPLSLPGIQDVVVTGELRRQLEREKFSCGYFQPVDKAHVVHVDWSEWDQSAQTPPVVPKSGEPEDFILAQPHDHDAAASLGELWELVPEVRGLLVRERISRLPRRHRTILQRGSVPNVDIFRAQNMRTVIVTDRVRRFLEEVAAPAIEFEPVVIGNLPSLPAT